MKKTLLVLFAVLGLIGAGVYATREPRIDGSSRGAFEESMSTFRETLPDDRQGSFSRSIKDAFVGVTLENRELSSRVTLFELTSGKGKAAATQFMEKVCNRVDGMTLEEFRSFAAKSRKKKRELTNGTSQHASVMDVSWLVRVAFPAAQQVKLEPHEFVFRNRSLLIDLPPGAKVVEDQIHLPTGEAARLRDSLQTIDEPNARRWGMNRGELTAIAYVDDLVRIEKHDGGTSDLYKTRLNLALSEYTEFGADLGDGDDDKYGAEPIGIEPTMLLVHVLKTLRPAEPEPQEPIALLNALRIAYEPQDATSSDEVERLSFDENAAQLRVLAQFPRVQDIHIGYSRGDWKARLGEADPLRHCEQLRSLSVSPELDSRDVNAVFQHSELENLELSVSDLAGKEFFDNFTKLKHLERVRLQVRGESWPFLGSLTACKKLKVVDLALWTYGTGNFQFLGELPNLKELAIRDRIPTTLFQLVPQLQKLESLTVVTHEIPNDFIRRLRKNTALKRLSIRVGEYQVAAEDLEGLKELPLESLELGPVLSGNADQTADLHLKSISKIKSLKSLKLSLEPVTDVGLEHLRGMPNLETARVAREDIDLETLRASDSDVK